ncbi:MAG: exodeoxyribonuclease VII large subunit [Haloarculaceae archaeon]
MSGYVARCSNGDLGLVVYKSDPWLGHSVPNGEVRGIWRFYSARDPRWDTLVRSTDDGSRRTHSPLHPLQVNARDDPQTAIHGQDSTVNLLVKGANVQGDRAHQSIANGIHHLDRHDDIDLIIAGRGDGSDTDLKAFNTEAVAEALFIASIPSRRLATLTTGSSPTR